jgi:AbrB family looped-hinge helix DNA binding protein
MSIAQSKITAQGQISVPSEIRKKLGVGPGSIIEWDEKNNEVVVRKAGLHTSQDVHDALFPKSSPAKKSPIDVKEGVRRYVRKKHAGR